MLAVYEQYLDSVILHALCVKLLVQYSTLIMVLLLSLQSSYTIMVGRYVPIKVHSYVYHDELLHKLYTSLLRNTPTVSHGIWSTSTGMQYLYQPLVS